MKFFDNQLPPALAQYLRKRGFDCQHVLDVGLAESLDREICRYAEAQDRIIVSKDEDFLCLAAPFPKSDFFGCDLAIAGRRLCWRRLTGSGH